MNRYITRDTQMPGYLIFPRALLRTELTAAELSVYMLLLDRSRLSLQNEKWIDGDGRAFVCFPILELAKAIGRSDTAVKNALRGLEEKDLISRKRQGLGKPSRIYVKLPEDGKEASSPESRETSPAEGANTSPAYGKEASSPRARRLPPNKNYTEKTMESSGRSKRTFGYFRNLTLTAEEAQEVSLLPDGEAHAERVALYMAGGYQFPDPMKTIRALARGVPMQEIANSEHWPLTRRPPEPSPERPPSYP